MASWQTGDGSTIFTAAGSQNLFGGSGSWCGSGCGQCYELTNSGYIAAEGQGSCTGAGDTITVMITNLCPANGNAQWCSQPTDQYGYGAHFDILSQNGPAGWSKSSLPSSHSNSLEMIADLAIQTTLSSLINPSPAPAHSPPTLPHANAHLARLQGLAVASWALTRSTPFSKELVLSHIASFPSHELALFNPYFFLAFAQSLHQNAPSRLHQHPLQNVRNLYLGIYSPLQCTYFSLK